MTLKPVRIGIIGAAEIAKQFIKGCAGLDTVAITTVASRTAEKAEAFARETGLPRSHGSYEALLADAEIDAIYNPLPNSLHAEWSIKAVEAGKHLLCEKPLAANETEAKAMFAASHRHKVHLVEAYPYLSQPMTLRVRDLIRNGVVGRPQMIRATFGIPFSDPNNIRLKADLAGGATMDAGSYAASFVRVMAGERPVSVQAIGAFGSTNVDMNLVGNFAFASGMLAQVGASFTTGYHRHGMVIGDAGSIETMFLNHPPMGGPAEIKVRRGTAALSPIETLPVPEGNGFRAEAESFARLIATGDVRNWNGASEAESIDIAAMLDALIKSARSGSVVAL